MQIYPHWLDGEFVRVAENSPGGIDTADNLVRALKLHALLGTQFVLSDVQVFDSKPVLRLFADEQFRKFVANDTDFLELRVDPDPAMPKTPFAYAARGLARSQSSGWTSSLFMGDAAPIRAFGEETIKQILTDGLIDPDRPTPVDVRYQQHRHTFQAIRHAISYFGMLDPPTLLAAAGSRTSYYDVLSESLVAAEGHVDDVAGNKKLPHDYREYLLSSAVSNRDSLKYTIDFIDRHIDSADKRNARSQLLYVLDREQSPRRREVIWNNAVQAWNYATELTLRPEGGSVGNLPNAVSASSYLAAPVDALVPLHSKKNEGIRAHRNISSLPLDLDGLDWQAIAKARRDSAQSMKKLAQCRARFASDPDAIAESVRVHIRCLTKSLVPPKQVSPLPYVLTTAGASGAALAIAVFGDVDAANIRSLVPLATTALGWSGAMAGSWSRDSDVWRRRNALTNTLSRAATGKLR